MSPRVIESLEDLGIDDIEPAFEHEAVILREYRTIRDPPNKCPPQADFKTIFGPFTSIKVRLVSCICDNRLGQVQSPCSSANDRRGTSSPSHGGEPMNGLRVAVLLVLMAGWIGGTAEATPITGDSISVFFSQPNNSSPYSGLCSNTPAGCFNSQSFVVGPGIETTFFCCGSPQASIDFSDNALAITWSGGITGNYGGTFAGFVFTNATNSFSAINTVSGFPSANVSVAGNKLYVNLYNTGLGISIQPGTTIGVSFGSPAVGSPAVPEPASLLLLGSGLTIAAARRRLRTRT